MLSCKNGQQIGINFLNSLFGRLRLRRLDCCEKNTLSGQSCTDFLKVKIKFAISSNGDMQQCLELF